MTRIGFKQEKLRLVWRKEKAAWLVFEKGSPPRVKKGGNWSDSHIQNHPRSPKHQGTDSAHPETVTWWRVLLKRRTHFYIQNFPMTSRKEEALRIHNGNPLDSPSTLRQVVKTGNISGDSESACVNAGDLGSIPGREDSEKKRATHSSLLVWGKFQK